MLNPEIAWKRPVGLKAPSLSFYLDENSYALPEIPAPHTRMLGERHWMRLSCLI